MSDTLKKNDSKIAGAVGTILVHLLLLLAILFLGLRTVLPTEEEGLTVNYGNTDSGDGLFEPAPMSDVAKELEQELPQESSVPDVSASQNEQITQDTEESIEIKKQREEAKRKERERLAEEKRKRDEQARIERERREREEKIKKASSTAQNAFSNANAGKGTDTGATSQGIAGGTGNQGKPDGNADSKNYSGGGTGASSYSLNGRSIVGSVPKPQYQQNVEGIIVVTIEVDATGKVISARAGAQGTTIGDASLRKAAEQAALKAKFNQIGGTTVQTGTITYRYKLN